jgi:two-component system cell cycle response regulator DivK
VDGQAGHDMAHGSKPDLILLDMSLPIMDGWEVARQLKSHEDTKGIPIIALTAHARAGYRKKSHEAGCYDYHTTPVDYKRLRGKIDAILAGA